MPDTLPSVDDLIHAPPEVKQDMAETRLFWCLRDCEFLAQKARDLQTTFGAKLSYSDRRRVTRIKDLLDGIL